MIADNSSEFRRQLKNYFLTEKSIKIIAEAGDGEQAISQTLKLKPDIVLMDVGLQGKDSFEATREILSKLAEIKIIMLAVFDIDEYRQAAKEAGACGYVIKKNLVKELMPALESFL